MMLLENFKTIHHRWMMGFLRKRGWVVFYLEESARKCTNNICWLKLYQEEILKDRDIQDFDALEALEK